MEENFPDANFYATGVHRAGPQKCYAREQFASRRGEGGGRRGDTRGSGKETVKRERKRERWKALSLSLSRRDGRCADITDK